MMRVMFEYRGCLECADVANICFSPNIYETEKEEEVKVEGLCVYEITGELYVFEMPKDCAESVIREVLAKGFVNIASYEYRDVPYTPKSKWFDNVKEEYV